MPVDIPDPGASGCGGRVQGVGAVRAPGDRPARRGRLRRPHHPVRPLPLRL